MGYLRHAPRCPSTSTCTARATRDYAIADNFFQAAFGGSFLNHQWLIAARDTDLARRAAVHSVAGLERHADRATRSTPRRPGRSPRSGPADVPAPAAARPTESRPCVRRLRRQHGRSLPYQPFRASARKLPPQTEPTIGDELSAAGVDWAWYSGGWSNANGTRRRGLDERAGCRRRARDPNVDPERRRTGPYCPDKLFQYHHQPFNYYAVLRARAQPAARAPAATRPSSSSRVAASSKNCNLEAGQLRQADRPRERASRLRERGSRQRPPRPAVDVDRGQQVREGHDGDRHVRRVRRSVGSRRPPARVRRRAARSVGPGRRGSRR